MTNISILQIKNLSFYYSQSAKVLKNITMDIYKNKVTSIIGPSGCGKTTLLRSLNRMHDLYQGIKYTGEILYNNKNILIDKDLMRLRANLGMVFQKPTSFPMSIYNNIAYGLRLKGIKDKKILDEKIQTALKDVALWDEVKDRLNADASGLSGGQQQRLVIARALAIEPDVILFDEPTSALDPISTSKIEELVYDLKQKVSIVIVTHNMQQAARISDYTAFMYLGELIEYDKTDNIFTAPEHEMTEKYISGAFG